jgi:uncharacterized integral membrane protein
MAAVILVIIAITVVTLFSVQNAMPVAISFLAWQFDASLAVIALLFFLAGLITGAGVMFWIQMRRRARKKRMEAGKQPGKAGSAVV